MKYYRLLKAVGNGFRFVLLIMALIGIAVLLKWPSSMHSLNHYDDKIINAYERTHNNAFLNASELQQNNPDAAIQAYQTFLDGVTLVDKGDRLYPLKRKALRNLLSLLRAEKQPEDALYWARLWVATDELDVYAQVQLGLALYQVQQTKPQALQLLAGLFKRFPESKLIAEAYATVLLEDGVPIAAFDVLIKNYRLQAAQEFPLFGWEVFWGFGDGFLAANRKQVWAQISSAEVITIKMDVPVQASEYRIDVPASLGIVILDPSLQVYRNHQKTRSTAIWQRPLVLKQMVLHNNTLIADGGDDPFFAWQLPESFRAKKDQLIFRARLAHLPSDILIKLIASEQVTDIEQNVLRSGDTKTLALIRALRKKRPSVANKVKQ